MPHRLARVSETNEDVEDDDLLNSGKEIIPINEKMRSPRSSNSLHVTINSKPEDMEYSDGSGSHNNGATGNRRPSAVIQEILSSRRPSAIMAAIRSPKQFMTRHHREYVLFIQFKYILREFDRLLTVQLNEKTK